MVGVKGLVPFVEERSPCVPYRIVIHREVRDGHVYLVDLVQVAHVGREPGGDVSLRQSLVSEPGDALAGHPFRQASDFVEVDHVQAGRE